MDVPLLGTTYAVKSPAEMAGSAVAGVAEAGVGVAEAEAGVGVAEAGVVAVAVLETVVEGNSTGPGAFSVEVGGAGGAGISAVLTPFQLCKQDPVMIEAISRKLVDYLRLQAYECA